MIQFNNITSFVFVFLNSLAVIAPMSRGHRTHRFQHYPISTHAWGVVYGPDWPLSFSILALQPRGLIGLADNWMHPSLNDAHARVSCWLGSTIFATVVRVPALTVQVGLGSVQNVEGAPFPQERERGSFRQPRVNFHSLPGSGRGRAFVCRQLLNIQVGTMPFSGDILGCWVTPTYPLYTDVP